MANNKNAENKTSNNSLFNIDSMVDSLNGQSSRVRYNRVALLDDDVARDLNTYRNWGEFDGRLQAVEELDSEGKAKIKGYEIAKMTKPLFSTVNGVISDTSYREQLNIPLLDSTTSRQRIARETDCSIANLVRLTNEGRMGRNTFQYADFMYCRYLNRVANNQMIVLRRFPYPCGDYIDYGMFGADNTNEIDPTNGAQGHLPDIARLVTWMGTPGNDMSNILKYDFNMRWEQKTASIDEFQTNDEGGGKLGQFLNATSPEYLRQVQRGTAGKQMGVFGNYAQTSGVYGADSDASVASSMYDKQKNYGPMDVIDAVNIRKTGLDFNHSISLTFDYELRSFDGINGRSAFLDLLANVLACTYTNGTFWGGERRVFGVHQSNVFANLPLMKDAANGKLTDLAAIGDSIIASFNDATRTFRKNYSKDGTWKDAISNFGSAMIGALMGGLLNKLGRPQKKLWNSLLVNAPTGMWHLMVGNPLHPIISVGNLILEKATIEHYGPLGLDDFPTGLRVNVTLKPARARDNADIERMYVHGDARIYAPLAGDVLKMYESSKMIRRDARPETSDTSTPTTRALDNDAQSDNNNANDKTHAKKPRTKDVGTTDNPKNDQTLSNRDYLLRKFFGTTATHSITTLSQEAFVGSHNIEKKRNANQSK